MKIPGSELALARQGGAEHTLIDFIGEMKDEYGTTVSNVRDKVDIKLSDETAASWRSALQYDTGFTLLPGNYTIKVLARDDETGRIGTYMQKFVIPNLNKEEKRIPISSVVLSSQRVDFKDALFNAAKDKGKAEAVSPLVQDGQKLMPSVTRVFSRTQRHVRLSAGLRAHGDGYPAAGGFRDFLSRPDEGIRDAAAVGNEAVGQQAENDAAEIQHRAGKLPPGTI